MRIRSIAALAALGATAIVVVAPAPPAGAAVTATTAGTVVQVTMTGAASATFSCASGNIQVNGIAATPALACGTVTRVNVTGDGGDQNVYSSDLDASAFTAAPFIAASLGAGADFAFETSRADQLDLGPGDDGVYLTLVGPANTSVDMGSGTGDRVVLQGSAGNDALVATSSTATVAVSATGAVSTVRSASGLERLDIDSAAGNDTISTTGVTAASTIDFMSLNGGAGNDTITDGPVSAALYGGGGTNTLTGGAGADSYWSESDTDVLDGGNDASAEYIYDSIGLRSGGRTLSGFTADDAYAVQAHQGDVVMRARPTAPSGTVLVTTSLTRTGQQLVPPAMGSIALGQSYVGELAHRGLADIVAGSKPVNVVLPSSVPGLIDITIPSGTWTLNITGTNLSVLSSYGTITASNVTQYRLHYPWTDRDRGFAHRVTRDLMFRFASESDLDEISAALDAGTTTRGEVADTYLDLAEYRGLDVDRTFVKYLRRKADPGGRTFWINSLGSGKALWRFRAQLFGSNEYFTKAGGTNASYVARAYNDVLGRNPDPSGQSYWTNKLNAGADRGSVALQFINSPEARRRLVDDQFLRFLDRKPTAGEQTTWVDALPSATGERDLIRFLVTSGTYYNRS